MGNARSGNGLFCAKFLRNRWAQTRGKFLPNHFMTLESAGLPGITNKVGGATGNGALAIVPLRQSDAGSEHIWPKAAPPQPKAGLNAKTQRPQAILVRMIQLCSDLSFFASLRFGPTGQWPITG
jgi:hypothetical protein